MSEEKTFNLYDQLLPEMRTVVIDEMEPTDRCRFTRCSRRSQKEAKKSKNYIYGLEIQYLIRFERYRWVVSVNHIETSDQNTIPTGYSLVFMEEGGQKYISYQLQRNQENHRIELDGSVDLTRKAFDEFKKMVQIYQNIIKTLILSNSNVYDFGITGLKNLVNLELGWDSEVLPFLTMIQRPLNSLRFQETVNYDIITAGDQIYQVKDWFKTFWMRMNFEQFKRMNARNIEVDVLDLTAQNVYDFINSWKNGTIRDTFQYCCWQLTFSCDFDREELFQLLGFENNNRYPLMFEIEHDTVVGRTSTLIYDVDPVVLKFRVPTQDLHPS